MAKQKEYQQAKDLIEGLELHKQVIVTVKSTINFRKYLSEIGKPTGKKYLTYLEKNQVFVVRVK